jgi:hypothetical protein
VATAELQEHVAVAVGVVHCVDLALELQLVSKEFGVFPQVQISRVHAEETGRTRGLGLRHMLKMTILCYSRLFLECECVWYRVGLGQLSAMREC